MEETSVQNNSLKILFSLHYSYHKYIHEEI